MWKRANEKISQFQARGIGTASPFLPGLGSKSQSCGQRCLLPAAGGKPEEVQGTAKRISGDAPAAVLPGAFCVELLGSHA